MSTFVGIDLGTTFSAVSVIDETGRPVILHNTAGQNITPSCVLFKDGGAVEVGEEARRSWQLDPNVAARFKRNMGEAKSFSIKGQDFTPTELSALVLKKLRSDVIDEVGNISEAVVTIPANFSHEAREATLTAAKSAGLNVNYIINEPTAAALYYAFKSGENLEGTYAVYDLGGGTFDISIINVRGQDIQVLSTNGVSKLGGDDFDAAIQKIVQRKFKSITGEELEDIDFTKVDAEMEKKSLSKRDKVSVRVARKIIEISRDEFEEEISSLIAQTEMLCEATLDEADVDVEDVKGVLLVGGSTRIPAVISSVRKLFGKEPLSSVNVDEVVALGASLYAAYKGDKSKLSHIQRSSIEKISVNESTSKCFGTIALSVDDETGNQKLANTVLIHKGSEIPCSVTESFFTVRDGQARVSCDVTESTAPESDPRFVKVIWEGSLELPEGRDAGQEIQITYEYDANQIMKCSFKDVETGRVRSIDLSMTDVSKSAGGMDIEKFLVE